MTKPLRFTDYIHLRVIGKSGERPIKPGGKAAAKAAIEAAGGRAMPILRTFADPADLDFSGLPERLVLKPMLWWSAKGVMLLVKQSDARYRDLMSGKCLTLDEIKSAQAKVKAEWERQGRTHHKLIVEPLVEGENGPDLIPLDYKFYTFNGDIAFVLQIDRNVSPPAFAFFDGEFEPCNYDDRFTSDWSRIQRGQPIVPRCVSSLVAEVKKVSANLRTPFISVDTYASTDGPIIGELSSTPGAPYYGNMFALTEKFDRALGRRWHKASLDLGMNPPSLPAGERAPAAAYLEKTLKETVSRPIKRCPHNFAIAAYVAFRVLKNFFQKRPLLDLLDAPTVRRRAEPSPRRSSPQKRKSA